MKRIAGVHPDWGITVVRLLIGLLLAIHGYQKSRVDSAAWPPSLRLLQASRRRTGTPPHGLQRCQDKAGTRATWIGCCSSRASSSSLLAPGLPRSTASGGNVRDEVRAAIHPVAPRAGGPGD